MSAKAEPESRLLNASELEMVVDDVDAAVEELRAKGAEIAIGPLTRNSGLRLAFIRGPEGIMIELVQR